MSYEPSYVGTRGIQNKAETRLTKCLFTNRRFQPCRLLFGQKQIAKRAQDVVRVLPHRALHFTLKIVSRFQKFPGVLYIK